MNLSIMKVEVVVFGVIRAVMINNESTLPGLRMFYIGERGKKEERIGIIEKQP